jgi:hypothetical protein
MTPLLVNDPEHWRTRRQVMRQLAGQVQDKNTREIMLWIITAAFRGERDPIELCEIGIDGGGKAASD